MKRVFITTTNGIENAKILNYCGIVSSHIVAGTGFFSDFAAGLSDFFGGRSGTYRNQLNSLYDEAIDELSHKANLLGANGIIGLHIDFDNISGKNMSMFMITAVGTAVNVQFEEEKTAIVNNNDSISIDTLQNAIQKKIILKFLEDKILITSQEEWATIYKKPDNDYIQPLVDLFFDSLSSSYGYDLEKTSDFRNKFSSFVKMAERKLIIKSLYDGLKTNKQNSIAIRLVNDGFFDAPSILNLIKEGNLSKAIQLLEGTQPSYNENDLKNMIALEEALDNLPNTGKIEMVKGGVFSKDAEKFICECGQKNKPEETYCTVCGRNIKGLIQNQVDAIEKYKNKVQALRELLS